MLLAPQDQKLRRQPDPQCLQSLDNGVTGGAKRNHQCWLRDAGHAMMHDDPVAVFLRGTIEASLASPMVALQDRFPMSAEMLPVVMLARQTSMAHPASYDLERAAGTERKTA